MTEAAAFRIQGWRAALLTALLALLAYFAFALLIDPRAGIEQARSLSIRLAFNAACAATGALLAIWPLPEHRRNWRIAVLLMALAGTIISLCFLAEPYRGQVLPPLGDTLTPMIAGAVLAIVLAFLAPAVPDFGPQPSHLRVRLWSAIGVALLLAAPMIIAPVIQHWNASGWMDSHGYDTYAHNILSGKAPAGSSQYMPVYQYGLAAVYFVFGHFFFVQQLVNVLLTFLTIALLSLAAWNLFRNIWAVLLVGVWSAFLRQFIYAVFFTQIESWYTPMIAFTIFSWTCYWRSPSRRHLVMLAVSAAIAMNTRNQGAFYFAWLCLAPFFVAALPWRRRLLHSAAAIAILALSLIPWSIRNYVVDGRFSPSAARNSYYLAVLNDPRIGFYGVRYWEGWGEITADYDRRYPDPVQRDRVMMRDGLSAPLRDPAWFARAVYWRTVAFYGLIPPAIFHPEGPRATDWSAEWKGYVYWRSAPLLFLPLSILGLVLRPGRVTFYLMGAVLASVAASAMAGGSEDRVSYPVLPMHMLMGLAAIFAPMPQQPGWSVFDAVFGRGRARIWAVAAAAIVIVLIFARVQFGRENLYAPQSERNVFVAAGVAIDDALPSLNDLAAQPATAAPSGGEQRVRARLIALNYHCPPKYGGPIDYMPAFATDPNRETYYFAGLPLPHRNQKLMPIGVSWFGASVSEQLREGDEVDVEGRLILAPENTVAPYWIRIEKARKVVPRTSDIPAFF